MCAPSTARCVSHVCGACPPSWLRAQQGQEALIVHRGRSLGKNTPQFSCPLLSNFPTAPLVFPEIFLPVHCSPSNTFLRVCEKMQAKTFVFRVPDFPHGLPDGCCYHASLPTIATCLVTEASAPR